MVLGAKNKYPMQIKAHSFLSEIKNYVPGKSAISGKKAIKLSSNENALGSSPLALAAYTKHGEDVFRYADGSCTLLREKLAQKNNIDAGRIVCGAGSDENIALITHAFAGQDDEVIYTEHGFLMYPISAKRVGAMSVKVPEKNLKADVDAIIAAITDKTRIIFIANPNNPTGSYLNANEVARLIDKTPKNVLIVLDHAYDEFVTASDYPNALALVEKNDNVVVTRTFSKIYGLASLRIGWSYSSQYVADILNKIRGPFNVGGPAQVAAAAALDDDKFLEKSKEHNQKWREILTEEIAKCDFDGTKIIVHPSQGNFILLDFGSENSCQKANEFFLENGFVLREMSAYGLPNCLRMTVGSEEENSRIIQILKK